MNRNQNNAPATQCQISIQIKIATLLAAAAVIVTLAVAPSYAQSGDAVEVKIPFSFRAGDLQAPAGKYTLEPVNAWFMILRNPQGDGRLLVMTTLLAQATDRPLQPRLVFHRYGSHYFLAEIWTLQRGQKLPTGSAEREAMAAKQAIEVAVAAHRSH